ncbi:hypothetical protein CONPUDRAFT_74365 [Coniophora puteana RWD-64-598 SS2]|uniref:Alpha-type protein kinase domain-containing protein n=1 Tax=Coniophora puteana (strain RWD-64-598) TaxID=741705 RepID=A0A5M3MM69_CONPW|nr:uncharacterized protein CONPUDRAFT_74365 [Coniophora puteana RWD-64-598 SS2]EIW80120.1 hypothetical protein CONPUDRAFT_74365 [Coniophora puteana RWD-64-598 SS2]
MALHHLKPEGLSGTKLVGVCLCLILKSNTAKNPTPKLVTNVKVSILLFMKHTQFEDILEWKEEIHHGGNGPSHDHTLTLSAFATHLVVAYSAAQAGAAATAPHPINPVLSTSSVVPQSVHPFQPPDKLAIENAVAAQRYISKNARAMLQFEATSYDVVPVPSTSFNAVIKNDFPFIPDTRASSTIVLAVIPDRNSMVGFLGAFKTCYPATVRSIIHSAADMLVLELKNAVAKCIYFKEGLGSNRATSGASKQKQYGLADKLHYTAIEANIVYWGNGLINLAYHFIDSHPATKTSPISESLPCLLYLLEERIDHQFIKYINNDSVTPCKGLSKEEEEIANFLCFVQHVQYQTMHRVAFLSDFQGGGNLLTNPQIITRLLTRTFADQSQVGNISKVLARVIYQKQCQHFLFIMSATTFARLMG